MVEYTHGGSSQFFTNNCSWELYPVPNRTNIYMSFQNYSQTYAASIATFAPFVVMILGKFGVNFLEGDVVMIASALVSAVGFIWQIAHRFSEGDVTPLGVKK